MVKINFPAFRLTLGIASGVAVAAFFTGCSLSRWWGESSQPPVVVRLPDSGPLCPELGNLITGSDEESAATFQCITSQLEKVWSQLEGNRPDVLTESEIGTLVHNGLIHLQGSREAALQRVLIAKRILGFSGDVTRRKLDGWIRWARVHLPVARRLYRLISKREEKILYGDVEEAMQLSASLLQRLDLNLDSATFTDTLLTLFDIRDPQLRHVAPAASEAAINLLNMVCPTFKAKDTWESKSMATCIRLAQNRFPIAARWVEFLLNPVHDLSQYDVRAIKASLDGLSHQLKTWFLNPALSPAYVSRWMKFSIVMGAFPPDNFSEALKVIRKFKGQSTEDAIYPEAFPYIFDTIAQSQTMILEGMSYFIKAVQEKQCKDPATDYWTRCALSEESLSKIASPEIKRALQVKSTKHGINVSPFNGENFSRIMLFHSIAGRVIEVFNTSDKKQKFPVISTDLNNEQDDLVQMITTCYGTAKTLDRFYDNLKGKIEGKAIPIAPAVDLTRWDIKGLARLLTLTNDILVRRTPEEHSFFKGLLSHLTNVFPGSSKLFLDQLAVTAIITTLDSLVDYRRPFVESIQREIIPYVPGYQAIDRKELFKNLPDALKKEFPRTFAGCDHFGFEKSCGISFDEILSDPPKGSDQIPARELDILILIAISMEGIVDSCDFNQDSKLSWRVLDGDDELDCGFSRSKDILERLIESKIVELKTLDQAKAALILKTVNSTFLTRIAGKVALIRGTSEYLFLNLPIFFTMGDADLGSMYGLLADTADPDRARAIPSKNQ